MRLVIVIIAVMFGFAEPMQARALSICEIQYIADANGVSLRNGQIVNCLGGIVVHKYTGPKTPRLVLYDPNNPDGWGGIMVKDINWVGAFDDVNLGDWVSFSDIEIEEYRGTTFLQFKGNATLTVVSTNNPIPKPLPVTVSAIAAPIKGIDQWIVSNHSAEKYESMLIKVINVTVADMGYGKANDNYILESNFDPNQTCWASDYMNSDIEEIGFYHPYVDIGQSFCGVTGILEQYTKGDYDYYQLLTKNTEDFIIYQTADLDYDCDVDFEDLGIFMGHWMQTDCAEHDNCGGADMAPEQPDGVVDILDLIEFIQYLLEEKS